MVKCCKAEQAISRGGYKQQMGIIIDSVTQAFYMHEEQRLKDFLVHLKILVSQLTSCSVMHAIDCTLLVLQLFISDPVCLSEWVSEAWEVWSDHNTPPRTVNGHSFMLDRQKMPLISLFMVSKEPGCSGAGAPSGAVGTASTWLLQILYSHTHNPEWHIWAYRRRSSGLVPQIWQHSYACIPVHHTQSYIHVNRGILKLISGWNLE